MRVPAAGPALRDRRIGLSYASGVNLFFRDLAAGVREAAAARGVGVLVRECGESMERQLRDINDLLDEGIDVLMISPVDSAAICPAIEDATRRGVPVFTVDRAAIGCPVASHVTSDNRLGGRLAATFLARTLGGQGEVAVVAHQSKATSVNEILGAQTGGVTTEPWTLSSVAERIDGFREVLAQDTGLRIVAEVSGGTDRETAREVARALLQAHPAMRGIFAVSDVTALAALDALCELGREESVVIVGYDATPEACAEILRGGPLRGDVAQFPARIGYTVVELWTSSTEGLAVPPEVLIPVELVTSENVQRFTGAERLLRVHRGEVWTAGERVVFFPVRGYQLMLNEIHAASPDLLRRIVYRSGSVLGESIARQVRELYPDARDLLFVLLEDLSRSGFGTFELQQLDLDAGQVLVRGQNLFEASIASGLSWVRTPRCVDTYCSGRLAGYVTAIAGHAAVCEETLCEWRGDPYCQFAITVEATPPGPPAAAGT